MTTVLGFWDFAVIAWLVAIFSGGSTYLSSRDTSKFDALEKQIAELTAELRTGRADQ